MNGQSLPPGKSKTRGTQSSGVTPQVTEHGSVMFRVRPFFRSKPKSIDFEQGEKRFKGYPMVVDIWTKLPEKVLDRGTITMFK